MLRFPWTKLVAPNNALPEATAPPPVPQIPPSELEIYRGYQDDDLALFEEFTAPTRISQPDFIVDFLGARTRVASLYDPVTTLGGLVQGAPVPGDYHAETVEWLGLLKTVKTARTAYTAMEWGAGWAPWLIAGATAARHKGIRNIKLYGIEADPLHYQAMRQHFIDNHLPVDRHVLLQAAVGVEAGSARWPKHPDPRNAWGVRPVRAGSDEDDDYNGGKIQEFMDVEILGAAELLRREPSWDMVHIDIQGWEGEVCRSSIDVLSERVKWVIIAVHSRILDGELLQLFHNAGWSLEHEKPTRFHYSLDKKTFESMVAADGTQVWRNVRLTGQG